MSKTVQMSIKMEPELYEQFLATAEATHTPASQILRQLMRKFIALHETPNALTIAAMQAADKGEGKKFKSAQALFEDLDI